METNSDSIEFTEKFGLNTKDARTQIKTFEKECRRQRELTQQLLSRLKLQLDRECRAPVRKIYLDSLNELENLSKHQDQLKNKWIENVDLFRSLSNDNSVDSFRAFIGLWLQTNLVINSFTNISIECDIENYRHGKTELQLFIMTITNKLTMLIIWITKKNFVTLSLFLDSLVSKLGPNPNNDKLHGELHPLLVQLAGKGDGKADKEASVNLKAGMKQLTNLWNYIDAETEKRVKYLSNLKVDISSSLPQASFNLKVDFSDSLPQKFFTYIEKKIKFLEYHDFLAFDREEFLFPYIFLDDSHRQELVEITDMVKLTGYLIKRSVLFPILARKEVSRKICSVCLKEDEKHLSLCRWCLGVTYCSQECYDMDKPMHKMICGPSKVDKIKRKCRIKYQAIDVKEETELKERVKQFYEYSYFLFN